MALSEKKRLSNDKWIKENYKQVKLSMPKTEAETLETYCNAHNLTKAGFIRTAIKEKMQRDQTEIPASESALNEAAADDPADALTLDEYKARMDK